MMRTPRAEGHAAIFDTRDPDHVPALPARRTRAIEFAMIASGVSIVIAATIIALGTTVKSFHTTIAAAIN
jgi:hypothetical protein